MRDIVSSNPRFKKGAEQPSEGTPPASGARGGTGRAASGGARTALDFDSPTPPTDFLYVWAPGVLPGSHPYAVPLIPTWKATHIVAFLRGCEGFVDGQPGAMLRLLTQRPGQPQAVITDVTGLGSGEQLRAVWDLPPPSILQRLQVRPTVRDGPWGEAVRQLERNQATGGNWMWWLRRFADDTLRRQMTTLAQQVVPLLDLAEAQHPGDGV